MRTRSPHASRFEPAPKHDAGKENHDHRQKQKRIDQKIRSGAVHQFLLRLEKERSARFSDNHQKAPVLRTFCYKTQKTNSAASHLSRISYYSTLKSVGPKWAPRPKKCPANAPQQHLSMQSKNTIRRSNAPAHSSYRTNLTLTDCQISNGSTIALRTHIETSRNIRSFGQVFLTPIFLTPTCHPSFTFFPSLLACFQTFDRRLEKRRAHTAMRLVIINQATGSYFQCKCNLESLFLLILYVSRSHSTYSNHTQNLDTYDLSP